MKTVRTGICYNCGKKKEEHFGLGTLNHEWCEEMQYDGPTFYDSGIAKLTEHQEELFEAAELVLFEWGSSETYLINDEEVSMSIEYANRQEQALDKLESIITKIKPSK